MVGFNVSKKNKAIDRATELRDSCWPDLNKKKLWNRKEVRGFITIPRTMPQLINIIDSLTKNKPAGRTYFVLWCRTFDHSMVVIDNPMTLAMEAGFSGERALSTWKVRMASLVKLGLLDAKDGPTGAYHYVLLYNPHKVIWNLKEHIQGATFRNLQARTIQIGAGDLGPIEAEETEASEKTNGAKETKQASDVTEAEAPKKVSNKNNKSKAK
jgi:hypothetical protein